MIPKVVHRIWLGGDEPEWTRAFRASWEREGWTVSQWSEPAWLLANQDVYDAAPDLVRPEYVGQLRSDILRYEILQSVGGVYVDCDVECLRPLDPLLFGNVCLAGWEIQNRVVNNAVLAAEPGAAFINRIIRRLPLRAEEKRGHRPNQMTGPGLMTEVHQAAPGLMTVVPQHVFYPYGFAEIRDHGPGEEWPGSYAVHHWANQRRERAVPA